MCQVFIPTMKRTGRIVNLSSIYSELDLYSDEVQQRFRNPRSLDDLEDLITSYQVSQSKANSQHDSFEGVDAEVSVGKCE